MSTIQIGSETQSLCDFSESWVNQQINRRRKDGQNVCVQVRIKTSGIDVRLATPGCDSGGGGGRPPNEREREVFDAWNAKGLNSPDFTGGNLIAFLKQVGRSVC